MADRQRLSVRRFPGDLPLLHLAIGIATLLLVIVRRPVEGDALGVYSIADRIAQGLIPYRDFPVEYPPLGLLHIYLPRLLGGPSEVAYEWLFTIVSISVTVATGAVVYWLARHDWSVNSARNTILLFTSFVFAAAPVVVWRFDILPTLMTAVALALFAANREIWAGVSLGLGTATKLYPTFLGPVFFGVRVFERRYRSAAALVVGAAVTVGVIVVQLYLLAGLDAFSYVLYQEERGVEIESVAGGLALLGRSLGAVPAELAVGFGAWQVTSPLLDQIALPLTVFNAAAVLALVAGAVWRFRADVRATGSVAPATVVAILIGTLLVVILTNKVFSPQYLVWLLPFAALMPRRQSLLLVVILALTTLIYPLAFQSLIRTELPTVVALNVRNLLLLALFVWVIWPPDLRRGSEGRDVRQAAD